MKKSLLAAPLLVLAACGKHSNDSATTAWPSDDAQPVKSTTSIVFRPTISLNESANAWRPLSDIPVQTTLSHETQSRWTTHQGNSSASGPSHSGDRPEDRTQITLIDARKLPALLPNYGDHNSTFDIYSAVDIDLNYSSTARPTSTLPFVATEMDLQFHLLPQQPGTYTARQLEIAPSGSTKIHFECTSIKAARSANLSAAELTSRGGCLFEMPRNLVVGTQNQLGDYLTGYQLDEYALRSCSIDISINRYSKEKVLSCSEDATGATCPDRYAFPSNSGGDNQNIVASFSVQCSGTQGEKRLNFEFQQNTDPNRVGTP